MLLSVTRLLDSHSMAHRASLLRDTCSRTYKRRAINDKQDINQRPSAMQFQLTD